MQGDGASGHGVELEFALGVGEGDPLRMAGGLDKCAVDGLIGYGVEDDAAEMESGWGDAVCAWEWRAGKVTDARSRRAEMRGRGIRGPWFVPVSGRLRPVYRDGMRGWG